MRRKSLSNSLHGGHTSNYSREAITLDDVTTNDAGGIGEGAARKETAPEGGRKEEDGEGTCSFPSPPKNAAAGTVSCHRKK